MTPDTPLDEAIDRLYSLPLDEFVAARNQLAKQFRGDDGKTVRALSKPSVVAWALNQVYWAARPVFERLVAAAARLREAQASGLLGRRADLRGADAAHREALLAAVREASRFLEHAGHDAGPDALRALTAALEALPWEERPGRLVRPPEPAGFAAFAGMPIVEPQARETPPRAGATPAPKPAAEPPAKRRRERETVERAQEREQRARGQREQEEHAQEERARAERERDQRHRETAETARREAEAAAERLRAAQGQLARARDDERAARERLEETRRLVKDAEKTFRDAEREAAAAQAAARKAEARLGRET